MSLYQIKQSSTAYALVFFMVDSADHISGKTGLSPTVTLSKNGGSFSSPSGAVSEIANGFYKVAGNATDANTLGPLVLHATGTGADVSDSLYEVIAYDPQDAVRFGLTALPNANAGGNGGLGTIDSSLRTLSKVDTYSTGQDPATYILVTPANKLNTDASNRALAKVDTYSASQDPATYILTTPANKITTDSSGRVTVKSGISKNVAIPNFEFLMVDAEMPATGLTVTATRSIDGGAFGACDNSVSELSNGVYVIDLTADDLNGDVITFKFSATGADTRYITLVTTP